MSDQVVEKIIHDEHNDTLTVAHTQDVSQILEQNKRARDESASSRMGDMQKVATLPSIVVMQWMQEGINEMAPNREDVKRMKKKLNSPEFKYLRTGGGRL